MHWKELWKRIQNDQNLGDWSIFESRTGRGMTDHVKRVITLPTLAALEETAIDKLLIHEVAHVLVGPQDRNTHPDEWMLMYLKLLCLYLNCEPPSKEDLMSYRRDAVWSALNRG